MNFGDERGSFSKDVEQKLKVIKGGGREVKKRDVLAADQCTFGIKMFIGLQR